MTRAWAVAVCCFLCIHWGFCAAFAAWATANAKPAVFGYAKTAGISLGRKEKMKDRTWAAWMKVGSFLGCHQLAERSFFLHGCQFPVCARCTGVLMGYVVALLTCAFYLPPWWGIGCCLLPMAVDWGLQFFRIKESTNLRRLFTGFIGGYGLMMLYLRLFLMLIAFLWPR